MAYFQNVFNSDFLGYFVMADIRFNIPFKVGQNVNTSVQMTAWNDGPYDLSTNNVLTLRYSLNSGKAYTTLDVTLTAGSARTVHEVVADLNANAGFAAIFTALVQGNKLIIRSNYQREFFKAYVMNFNASHSSDSAERVLGFNKRAPVVELPSYFARHTVDNYVAGTYEDSAGLLVQLTQPNDNDIITAAGLSTTPKADYELLRGRASNFVFQKNTVDSSDRITQTIEYPAGAKAGDLAKKITYSYTGVKTHPDVVAEVPYTLTGSDLVSPP